MPFFKEAHGAALARLGGDRFAAGDLLEARRLAEQLGAKLQQLLAIVDHDLEQLDLLGLLVVAQMRLVVPGDLGIADVDVPVGAGQEIFLHPQGVAHHLAVEGRGLAPGAGLVEKGRDLVVVDLDPFLVGLEQDDLLLAEDIEQAGEELVVVFFLENVRVLHLDEIFQVAVGQGGGADGQDDLVFAVHGRVDRGGRAVAGRIFPAAAEKNRAQKKNDPLFVHRTVIIYQRRREFNGNAAPAAALLLTKERGKNIILEC